MEENTIMTFCPRTEGDGMESFDTPITVDLKSASVISSSMQALSLLSVKPPPTAERIISLIPTIATTGIKQKQTSSAMENKKAKFVPYEPYKAAVKPIIPLKKKLNKKGCIHQSITLGDHKNSKPLGQEWKTTHEFVTKQEYQKLLKEKEELNAQLTIQSKVNTELKKLLVASVGEDMEARVHFLTEDKVKLADDIKQYVEKIACDFEQKEKLSIESDVWRSKFLASSVVIEELTKWKGTLCKHNSNLQLCVQGLIDEMNTVQHNQQQTYNHIRALNKAFHPLGSSCPYDSEPNAQDVIETSESILKLAGSLSKRLLGTYTQIRDDKTTAESSNALKQSPAQLAAHEVLTKHPVGSCTMSELTNDINAHHVAALARRTMNKSFFTCCPHCTGQVHII